MDESFLDIANAMETGSLFHKKIYRIKEGHNDIAKVHIDQVLDYFFNLV